MKRRNFIKNSFGLLVAAPMVVRAESIMRIAAPVERPWIEVLLDPQYMRLGRFGKTQAFAAEMVRLQEYYLRAASTKRIYIDT